MGKESENLNPSSRLKNILLNLLVLVLLAIMVRTILVRSGGSDLVAYSNFSCSCRITLQGNWVQQNRTGASILEDYEVFHFRSAAFLAGQSIRVFHHRIDPPTAAGVSEWVDRLLVAMAAENIATLERAAVGKGNYQADRLQYDFGGWEMRLVTFLQGGDIFAIELGARNYSAAQESLENILESFEVIR